jgi:hypothetical protein
VRSDTQTVTIAARPDRVVAYVGDGASLPRWAIGFAQSVRPHGSGWLVTTGRSEVPTTITVDDTTGTIDFRMQAGPDSDATAYSRVVPNGEGSEFIFTQLQQPGVTDELFAQLVAAVGHELVALKAQLEVQCPL